MPQLKGIEALTDLDRAARLAIKGCAVGGSGGIVQEVSAVIGQKARQHLLGQFRIGKVLPASRSAFGKASGTNRPLCGARPRTIASCAETRSSESLVLKYCILYTLSLILFLYAYKPCWRYTVVWSADAGGYGIRTTGCGGRCPSSALLLGSAGDQWPPLPFMR